MSIDMDVVSVMAVVRVCTAQSIEAHDNRCIKLPDDGSLVIQNMLEQF